MSNVIKFAAYAPKIAATLETTKSSSITVHKATTAVARFLFANSEVFRDLVTSFSVDTSVNESLEADKTKAAEAVLDFAGEHVKDSNWSHYAAVLADVKLGPVMRALAIWAGHTKDANGLSLSRKKLKSLAKEAYINAIQHAAE
jgi:hypothetical protein